MAELGVEMGQIEVCVPRSVQAWRGLINWASFVLHIFLQILRGTPSLFSYVLGFGSRQRSLLASSPSFKPFPVVELPIQDSFSVATTHLCVHDTVNDGGGGTGDGEEATEKLTVVLDLDETLVCAYETSSLPALLRTQAIEAGLKWFELECVSADEVFLRLSQVSTFDFDMFGTDYVIILYIWLKEYDGKPQINYVTVFERPGLEEFLEKLDEFADIVLFTAGLEGYARPLVDKIDLKNRFKRRLYRPSTVSTEYREHVKDLSCISKDLCRVVIVDNNPFSFLLQPSNGIPCVPFSTGQPYDNQLLEFLLPLLKHLSLQKDVRPVLYERFHMPEWFQMHGVPASALPL